MRATTREEAASVEFEERHQIGRFAADPFKSYRKELGEEPYKRSWRVGKAGETSVGEAWRGYVDKDGRTRYTGWREMGLDSYNIEGSLRVEGTASANSLVKNIGETNRKVSENNVFLSRQNLTQDRTYVSQELNRRGTSRAFGVGGAVALTEFFNNWTPIVAVIARGGKGVGLQMLDLRSQAFASTRFPVPPKPAELENAKKRLNAMPFSQEKAVLQEIFSQIEEASNAYWGNK